MRGREKEKEALKLKRSWEKRVVLYAQMQRVFRGPFLDQLNYRGSVFLIAFSTMYSFFSFTIKNAGHKNFTVAPADT